MASGVLFDETLEFSSTARRGLVALISFGPAVTVVVLVFIAYKQLLMGEPLGENPLSNRSLIMLVMGVTLVTVLGALAVVMVMLKAFFRLRVTTRAIEVSRWPGADVRYRPRQIVSWEEIGRVSGIQIKYRGGQGWIHNFGGHHGIRVKLNDGKKVLWCTNRPEELSAALSQAQGRAESA